jgi:hypothetical protein
MSATSAFPGFINPAVPAISYYCGNIYQEHSNIRDEYHTTTDFMKNETRILETGGKQYTHRYASCRTPDISDVGSTVIRKIRLG